MINKDKLTDGIINLGRGLELAEDRIKFKIKGMRFLSEKMVFVSALNTLRENVTQLALDCENAKDDSMLAAINERYEKMFKEARGYLDIPGLTAEHLKQKDYYPPPKTPIEICKEKVALAEKNYEKAQKEYDDEFYAPKNRWNYTKEFYQALGKRVYNAYLLQEAKKELAELTDPSIDLQKSMKDELAAERGTVKDNDPEDLSDGEERGNSPKF